jgi:hypothetical protein
MPLPNMDVGNVYIALWEEFVYMCVYTHTHTHTHTHIYITPTPVCVKAFIHHHIISFST